jgi:hypothetical protein
MPVHLNSFTKNHILDIIKTLQEFYNVPSVHPASKDAVIDIYRAFIELIKIVEIDPKMEEYLKTKSGATELTETALLAEIVKVKQDMSRWKGDEWSADYPLRCMLVGLRHGKINYPNQDRGFLKRIFRIGDLSENERLDYEEKLLLPVAQNLIKIVQNYILQTSLPKIA